ncbi:MAG: thioredoxin domain-containing protein [Oscillospiraceae bacterium]|nr:thioredoxin domain-containing protein [Oscillospiraceae bacterium]
MTGNSLPNKLIYEKSPYLLQHAYNPVDWYPWGREAFEKAAEEDKPVFLSIGYSCCHWCHVMAHESFEDAEVADLLNRRFIAVKVDREERPDVDAVYMEVCQALTGSGGWPMTIITTPDKKPFFAATYLPKSSRYGMTGLLELLNTVSARWEKDRKALLKSGEEIASFMQGREPANFGKGLPAKELAFAAKQSFQRSFDKKWGGFGSAPKFPMPHNLIFLFRLSSFENDNDSRRMAEITLEQMYRGGIFDHIGGGLSRYSTDTRWLIPHFEKMLYDNALLIWACAEAFLVTKRPLYESMARKTADYVLSELLDISGGFICGQDADSEGVEGKYYAFTRAEIEMVLGQEDAEFFCSRFGIYESGNFEGKSIPNLLDCKDWETESAKISELRSKLYKYRLERTRIERDDKILCSWNAMMIVALTKAGMVFGDAEYLKAAAKAGSFISKNMRDGRGRLKIRWKDGEAAKEGLIDDYGFYGLALLSLYESAFDVSYLTEAAEIADIMNELFLDEQNGGYFMYSKDAEQLITRPKPTYDGAVPSGNSAAALFLGRLARLTASERFAELADRQMAFVSAAAKNQPSAFSLSLIALMESQYPLSELVCVSAENEIPDELSKLASEIPDRSLSVIFKTPGNAEKLAKAAPFTAEYRIPSSGRLYYLCRDKTCFEPVAELIKVLEMLS